MHINIRRGRLFYRYFFSYILILAIPLITMGTIVYGNFIKTLEMEVESANINMLSRVQSTVDMHLKELEYLVIRMEKNPRLTPYMVTKNGYKTYEAIQEVKNYKATAGSFVYEICLFLNEGDILYSSSGIYSVYSFLNYVYQFKNWDEDQLYSDLNIKGTSFLRPREEVEINGIKKSLITYILPLPTKDSQPYGSVIFIMDELVFTNMIGDILKDYKGYVYVLDDKNRIITSIGNERAISKKEITAFLPNRTNGQNQIFAREVDGTKYSISYTQSQYNNWKYITIMPSAQFLTKVLHTRMLMWGAFLFVVMVGGVLAITLSMNNYRPIRKLTDYAADKVPSYSNDEDRDELGFIAHSIDTMASTNEMLKNQLTVQRPMIKEQLLTMLLKGEDNQWNELVKLSYMNFAYPYFIVFLVAPRQSLVVSEIVGYKDRIMKLVGDFSFDGGNGYGVELIHDDAVAIIINGKERLTGKTMQESVAEQLQQSIIGEIGVYTIIAVGGVYEGDLRLIHRSFVEASAAMDYKLLKGKEGVIFFSDITEVEMKGSGYNYPAEEEIRLSQSLKQGDANMFITTLEEIRKKVELQQACIHEVKCIYFDVINTIIKTVNNLNISSFRFHDEWNSILTTISSGTIDDLIGRLKKICHFICVQVEKSKESKNTKVREDIIAYVQSNYQKPSFSLEMIADRFEMSSSYISRFFKDQTGETLAEYLTRQRLDAAKKLLVYTQKPIKEIVEDVGYLDDTSFIRKFKRSEGVTPGQYRNIHSKMETSIT